MPGLSLGDSSRNYATGKVAIPGDNLEYEELSVTFLVDESLNNWREIYNWMRGLAPTHINGDNQHTTLSASDFGLVSDGNLILMTNTGNPNITVSFKDLFPYSLGAISMNSSSTSIDPISCTASFRYTRFDLTVNDTLNSNTVPENVL